MGRLGNDSKRVILVWVRLGWACPTLFDYSKKYIYILNVLNLIIELCAYSYGLVYLI